MAHMRQPLQLRGRYISRYPYDELSQTLASATLGGRGGRFYRVADSRLTLTAEPVIQRDVLDRVPVSAGATPTTAQALAAVAAPILSRNHLSPHRAVGRCGVVRNGQRRDRLGANEKLV